jgi:DNA-binding FrmR family transcriptional regulator
MGKAKEALLSHTIQEKEKILGRLRRIAGQVEALERATEEERDCASILQQIAAVRGAVNSLMADLIEGEVRFHVLSPSSKPNSDRANAAEQLVQILRAYLK